MHFFCFIVGCRCCFGCLRSNKDSFHIHIVDESRKLRSEVMKLPDSEKNSRLKELCGCLVCQPGICNSIWCWLFGKAKCYNNLRN